ncbi:MAG: glutamate---cysteine ligase / carboxylate-amine ligase [Solirubrobacteraceae bacterium]|nr:glutamate---cysteine ligase / carboxylate-amine ligase [Solirubrobacteraceae bacterium]
MDHRFTGPDYTIGIEEELMILDAGGHDLANAMEELLGDSDAGEIKPELHESVLEIATKPCANVSEAGGQLRALRTQVRERAAAKGLAIASAGTHPYSKWEDQRISGRERYRDLIADLRWVARQELIFGLHTHVGIEDPETAIHVANGMRVHVPILLALSANSPFFRGEDTGLASARTPVFRQFPRIGIPPRYDGWADYERRMAFMVESGAIKDHTWLWYDVRIHPAFGTVEIRACDAQTRVEHTLALSALTQAMVRELAEHHRSGGELQDYPHEMLEENKWLAARHGLEGELVDLPSTARVPARALAERLLERLRPHAQDLGAADALDGLRDILDNGNGAVRQRKVYEANHDFGELVRDLVDASGG